jgi:hypothetical protein
MSDSCSRPCENPFYTAELIGVGAGGHDVSGDPAPAQAEEKYISDMNQSMACCVREGRRE